MVLGHQIDPSREPPARGVTQTCEGDQSDYEPTEVIDETPLESEHHAWEERHLYCCCDQDATSILPIALVDCPRLGKSRKWLFTGGGCEGLLIVRVLLFEVGDYLCVLDQTAGIKVHLVISDEVIG